MRVINTKKEHINLKNREIQDIFNGDFKYLPRRLDSDKVSHNKLSDFTKNLKHDEYQRRLNSMVSNVFDKTSGTFEKTRISPDNQQLAKELQKLIFRKCQKYKVPFSCGGSIRVTDLAYT